MVPLTTEAAPVGAELISTVSSVEYVFGATTALAFERAVRDMVRSRILRADEAAKDGDADGSGQPDRSPPE